MSAPSGLTAPFNPLSVPSAPCPADPLANPALDHPSAEPPHTASVSPTANAAIGPHSHRFAPPSEPSRPADGPVLDSGSAASLVNPLLRQYELSFTVQLQVISSRWAGQDLLIRFCGSSSLIQHYPTEPFTNERPYRDFERLSTFIQKQYPTNLIPALPSIPAIATRALERTFLSSCENFLYQILRHPVFATDHAVVKFCTSPAVFDPSALTSEFGECSPSIHVPSPTWSDKLKALVISGPKDIDAEFERRKEKCAELDFCLKALIRSTEKLSSAHQALSAALVDVSTKAEALGAAELNATLAGDWHKFGKCMQIAAGILNERAGTENVVLADRVNLALKTCGNVQAALDRRLGILEAYDDACKATEKHKRKMDKLRGGRPSEAKVGEALTKLDAIKTIENALRVQFRTASDLLARDWPAAEEARVLDLQEMIAVWARAGNDAERRILVEAWTPLRTNLSQASAEAI